VLGWSAILSSFAGFAAAFLADRRPLAYAGAAFAVPVCVLLSGAPLLELPAYLALASTCAAAVVFSRGRKDIAFALLLPFALLVTVLLVFTWRGIRFRGAF
jgi:hypothetical protein